MRYLSHFCLFLTISVFVSQSIASDPPVKLSSSGICHDETSAFYSRTNKYTVYESIEACLSSGGRLPKGHIKFSNGVVNTNISKYDRDDWPHWIDDDSDCQNTRHEILISTSNIPVKFKTNKGCQVAFGEWYDPYSGETFTDSTALDLDHIVPLGYASARNGAAWNKERKRQFANDPENLIAVNKYLNRQKGAAGPSEWMPPNHKYRCKYAQRFDGIVRKYGLKYFSTEKRVIDKMLAACS